MIIISSLAWAFFANASDDIPSTCQQLLEQKNSTTLPTTSPLQLLVKMLFDRQSLIDIQEVSPLESSITLPTKISSSKYSELTIFTLGHHERFTREDRATLKNISKLQKLTYKRLRTLLDTDSVNECVAVAAEIEWSPSELTELQNQRIAALESYRHQESKLSLKVAKKAIRRHPNWKIVEVDNWGEILQSIRSAPTAGIVVIAHSDTNGRLYDSSRGEFPSQFFSSLPDFIRFVGVYSCESAQVIRAYDLNHIPNKEIVSVRLGSPFDVGATTPIALFPTWMRELTHRSEFTATEETDTKTREAECSIRFQNLHLDRGAISVTVHGKPIGVWRSENADTAQLVPCAWLAGAVQNPSTLSLFIEPTHVSMISNQAAVVLDDYAFKIEIQIGSSAFRLGNTKVFKDKAGFFRSLLIE